MTIRRTRGTAGATLVEIIVAMLVIGMVATGIVSAFIFSRKMTWRSSAELSDAGLVTQTAEALRGAVASPIASGPNAGLTLTPGIYVDEHMQNVPSGAVLLAALNFPADLTRFQTDAGTAGATVAAANHGDGRLVVVEGTQDLDGDGLAGVSFDGGLSVALRRVRIRVKWTSPSTS